MASENALLFSMFLHLVGSQIATRFISFVLNVLVTRQLSPVDFGYSIQFFLLITTILFLSREGFRRGCLRGDAGTPNGITKVASVAWLTIPSGVATSILACATVLLWKKSDLSENYTRAVLLYGMASVFEILSEPCYIIAQNMCLVKLRAFVETAATLTRCVISYSLLLMGIGKDGGLVLAYGQVAYALCLFLGYWGYLLLFHQSVFQKRDGLYPPDKSLLQLCIVFTIQSFQKFILQEGEKFILVFSETTYNQGVYVLVENLGSLVVRTFLQTFEESAFTMFSKAFQDTSKRQRVQDSFLLATKLVSILGLTFAAFGPSYSYVLLRVLYGEKWCQGEAPAALGFYCLYVMVLSVNGVTEAFLHAVFTKEELMSSNSWLFVFSGVHIAISLIFIRVWGCIGLILANATTMSMRILYSTIFIRRIFKESRSFSLWRALPSSQVLLALALSALVTRLTEKLVLDKDKFYGSAPLHIGAGVACLSILATSIYVFEKSAVQELRNLRKRSE